MGLNPVIGGPGFYKKISGGGVSSAPGLPVWTYTAGAAGVGLFTTDNALLSSTSQIAFSSTDKSGSISWSGMMSALPLGTFIVFTNSTGSTGLFQAESPTIVGDAVQFTVSHQAGSGSWSGDYQVTFLYAIQLSLDILYSRNDPVITPFTGDVTPVTSISVVNGIITNVS